ncbi:MAG: Hsp20/alpha crystallin family protein [Desulfomonilia bacterium]
MQDKINRIFEESIRESSSHRVPGQWSPLVDIFEDDMCLVIKVELPGVKRDDIVLDISNGFLTIKGRKHIDHEDNAESFHMIERQHGFFKRSFSLPDGLDLDRIEAKYSTGVLEILLPKQEGSVSKRIPITKQ